MNYNDWLPDLEKRFKELLKATIPETKDLKSLAMWIFNTDAVLRDLFETINKTEPTLKETLFIFQQAEPEQFDEWLLGILNEFYEEALTKFPDFDQKNIEAMVKMYGR